MQYRCKQLHFFLGQQLCTKIKVSMIAPILVKMTVCQYKRSLIILKTMAPHEFTVIFNPFFI